jgi:hypothetical protein
MHIAPSVPQKFTHARTPQPGTNFARHNAFDNSLTSKTRRSHTNTIVDRHFPRTAGRGINHLGPIHPIG